MMYRLTKALSGTAVSRQDYSVAHHMAVVAAMENTISETMVKGFKMTTGKKKLVKVTEVFFMISR